MNKLYKFKDDYYYAVTTNTAKPRIGDLVVQQGIISDIIKSTDEKYLQCIEFYMCVSNGFYLVRKLPYNDVGKKIVTSWLSHGKEMIEIPEIKLTDTLLNNILQPIELKYND